MHDKKILPSLVLGLSIGWLVGLSVSEVLGSVLAALMGLVGGIGAGFVAWSKSDQPQPVLNLWPLALLSFGIALGASAGVYARGQQWLGNTGAASSDGRVGSGALYSVDQTRCRELLLARRRGPDALRLALRVELEDIGEALDKTVADDAAIDSFARQLCEKD